MKYDTPTSLWEFGHQVKKAFGLIIGEQHTHIEIAHSCMKRQADYCPWIMKYSSNLECQASLIKRILTASVLHASLPLGLYC